jgi:uncharacterized integral membrane protein
MVFFTANWCVTLSNQDSQLVSLETCDKPANITHAQLTLIYLLTAIGLTPGGSSTVHIYTQTPGGSSTVHIYTKTIHTTTQLTTFVVRLSGIRTQSGQTKINEELTA